MNVIDLQKARAEKNGGWRDYRTDPPPQNKPFRMKLLLSDEPCRLLYRRRGNNIFVKDVGIDRRWIRCSGVDRNAKWRPE